MLGTIANRLLHGFGLELRRRPGTGERYDKNVLFESDQEFHRLRAEGLARTGTPDGGSKSIEKLYNTLECFRLTRSVAGDIAECGCFRGLSAFMFCSYVQRLDPTYRGAGLHVFDSFEGLSSPTEADLIVDPKAGKVGAVSQPAGSFAAMLDHVKDALATYPEVTFHRGWIPTTFAGLAERRYRFVHIDVDLHEPTRDAIEYFYPRLATGGVIVCDDYGFLHWPGARRAIDEYCAPRGIAVAALTTGQCLLWKAPVAAG